jgi:hypothetical protein
VIFAGLFFAVHSAYGIEIDLSQRGISSIENVSLKRESVFEQMLTTIADPVQNIVILNMEKEFVPNTVRLKKNGTYRFYLANVNEKNKNVSFVLDAFNQNHGTYFGQVRVFELKPKTNGLFTFSCPETGIQGKIVVLPDESSNDETVGSR